MRDAIEGFLLMLLALVIVFAVIFGLRAGFGPISAQVERNIVENSKSFIDSQNIALANLLREHSNQLLSEQQRKATMNQACIIYDTLGPDVLSTSRQYIAQNGGCR